MKPLPMLTLAMLAAAAVAGACGGNPEPAPAPTPNADSMAMEQARLDSIAREQARQDSIRRAMEEAERVQRQAEADSLAALARVTDEVKAALAMMIHFDYDKATIRSDDQAALDGKVAILRANPALSIRITGHCDERGSDEYNLALGNRRANAAKQYLVNQGIDASRIEILSYGEERPISMDRNDAGWAQNRRAEFEIVAGGETLLRP